MRYTTRLSILAAVLGLVFITSLFIGRYSLCFHDLLSDELGKSIFWNIRLPRILTAALLGMALSVSGATLQSAFRNPLVSPGIIGVSQGAAFGAAFAILFLSNHSITIEISSTVFGLLALFMAYAMSSTIKYGGRVLRLILAGIVVSAFFSGGVGVMKCLADPLNQLPELTFWLLGSLSGIIWRDFLYALPLALGGILALLLARWRLNLLTLKDDVTISLGTNPRKLRALVVTAAVVATAAVTSVAGVIAWVGLIVPHMARKIFGINSSRVIPASALLGATLMIIFDNIARTVSPGEIPLGVVTSLLGAPLFVFLLSRKEVVAGG